MVAGLECFDTGLIPHLTILLLGIGFFTPLGQSMAIKPLLTRYPSLETKFGRSIAGLILIMFSGFTISAHTLWMHNKAQEMGGGAYCSGGDVCDCASVIGNNDWNTMPFIGLPWGLIGMIAFAVFLWIIISIAKEPTASWVQSNLALGRNFAIFGILIILYLMYAEYEIGKICQFCTVAHIAHVTGTVGLFKLSSMHQTGDWPSGTKTFTGDTQKRERRKRGGYVAPKLSTEEE